MTERKKKWGGILSWTCISETNIRIQYLWRSHSFHVHLSFLFSDIFHKIYFPTWKWFSFKALSMLPGRQFWLIFKVTIQLCVMFVWPVCLDEPCVSVLRGASARSLEQHRFCWNSPDDALQALCTGTTRGKAHCSSPHTAMTQSWKVSFLDFHKIK